MLAWLRRRWIVERALGAGQRRLAAGDAEGAASAFRRGAALAPASRALAWHEALALAAARRDDEAVAAARRAVDLAPDSPVAHLFLGRVLVEVGRAGEAEAPLARAIELDPTNRVARGWRAIACFETDRLAEGLALLAGPGVGESTRLLARLAVAMEEAVDRGARERRA